MTKIRGKIIVVDDEKEVALGYQRILNRIGYDVTIFDSAKKAIPSLTSEWPGILVTDIMMPEMDGITLMKKVQGVDPELPIVLVTGKGSIRMAVDAVKEGAYDFIEKPFDPESFQEVVKRALEKRQYVIEVRDLKDKITHINQNEVNLVGNSPVMERLKKIIKNVAISHADVLILGETGTGKDMVAKSLHQGSNRKEKPFVAINCGALPEAIIESELFGHEEGAFTGAQKKRIGKFEYADGGVVFLDEIESMPLHLQVKLLRVLQEKEVEPVGSNKTIPINIRVFSATKVDLREASDKGEFREDLYYRLNAVTISLPPLSQRKEDIPLLFHHFVNSYCSRNNQNAPEISRNVIDGLLSRSWKGNVRELKNEAEKFCMNLDFDNFQPASKKEHSPGSVNIDSSTYKKRMMDFEKELIKNELIYNKGSIKKTLESLEIPRQTLREKMIKYNLDRKNYF